MPIINRLFIIFLCCFLPFSASAEGKLYPVHFENTSGHTKGSYQVELAINDTEQMKGLMFRSSLPQQQGMLFHYPQNRRITMWMRNTFIPLDMVFVDSNMRINHIHPKAKPNDDTLISSPKPVVYVVELNGGEAERIGLKKGDKLILSQEARYALSR